MQALCTILEALELNFIFIIIIVALQSIKSFGQPPKPKPRCLYSLKWHIS